MKKTEFNRLRKEYQMLSKEMEAFKTVEAKFLLAKRSYEAELQRIQNLSKEEILELFLDD
jgi:hypothetical protein